jgi:uncharacterized cupin superfamily protein
VTCRVVHAARLELALEPLPRAQVQAGTPRTGVARGPEVTGLSIGVWEHTAGTSTDVEVDEVFVVLQGRATIEVEGGPVLEVGPGDLGVLEAGARTRWVVHEDLRKVFVCPSGHVANQEGERRT